MAGLLYSEGAPLLKWEEVGGVKKNQTWWNVVSENLLKSLLSGLLCYVL